MEIYPALKNLIPLFHKNSRRRRTWGELAYWGLYGKFFNGTSASHYRLFSAVKGWWWKVGCLAAGSTSWTWQTAAREVESGQTDVIAEVQVVNAGGRVVSPSTQRDRCRLRPEPFHRASDWRRTHLYRVTWFICHRSRWAEQTPQEKTRQ